MTADKQSLLLVLSVLPSACRGGSEMAPQRWLWCSAQWKSSVSRRIVLCILSKKGIYYVSWFKCICSQNPFSMEHLMGQEVSSVELTLGNLQLVNYLCWNVYKLQRDPEISCSHANPRRSENFAFQLQIDRCVEVCWVNQLQLGQVWGGGNMPQVLC